MTSDAWILPGRDSRFCFSRKAEAEPDPIVGPGSAPRFGMGEFIREQTLRSQRAALRPMPEGNRVPARVNRDEEG